MVTLALIFCGEALAIGAELWASKYVAQGEKWGQAFFILMIPMVLGGALLLLGYMYGYYHLKNIWWIAAASIASIVIVEPIVAVLLFQEMPTLGAGVGLTLGLLGLFAVILLP